MNETTWPKLIPFVYKAESVKTVLYRIDGCLNTILGAYLGKPIAFKLIKEIETDINNCISTIWYEEIGKIPVHSLEVKVNMNTSKSAKVELDLIFPDWLLELFCEAEDYHEA